MLPLLDSRPFYRGDHWGWGHPSHNSPCWGHLPEDWLAVVIDQTGNRFSSQAEGQAAAKRAFLSLPAWRQADLAEEIATGSIRWVPRLDYPPTRFQAGWPATSDTPTE